MKKFIFTLMIALLLPLNHADARKKDVSDMTDLIMEYKNHEDFDCISVGGMLLSLAKGMMRSEARGDHDAMAALSLLNGIKHITIADYGDCAEAVRNSFRRDAEKILRSFEMLLDAKSDGSRMTIYGNTNPDSDIVKGLILYAPDDDAVICIDCKVSMDELGAVLSDISD